MDLLPAKYHVVTATGRCGRRRGRDDLSGRRLRLTPANLGPPLRLLTRW
jgi:hypothetical protein